MVVFFPEEEIEATCSSVALSSGCSSILEQKISLLILLLEMISLYSQLVMERVLVMLLCCHAK